MKIINLRYICHRHGNQLKEETKRFGSIHSIWGSSMDAGRWADEWQQFWCACTVVFLLEDQSRWLWCHFMMSWGSLVLLREGTIRAQLNLWAVIWVFWYQAFGSINKPPTLYFGCLGASHGEEHNQFGMCDLFIHIHVPRPFWGTLS